MQDTDTDTDTDSDDDALTDEGANAGKNAYKQRVFNYDIDSIDKRQYMRFDIEGNQNPVEFEATSQVEDILDISRGGVSLKQDGSLQVGDIVPVELKYGDLEIKANVEIVATSDITAGGKFIDLDLATANKLLYLSIMLEEANTPIVQSQMNNNIQ